MTKIKCILSVLLVFVLAISATVQVAALSSGGDSANYTSYKVNNVNFFINLAGEVLDSADGAGHYAANRFTSALTSRHEVSGKDLQEDVCVSSFYAVIDSSYDALVGDTPDDYVAVDAEIRSTLKDYITFPSNSEILGSVKSQIANGTKVHDISGELVSESLITDDYYDVYWYVLKEANNFWHVDGILVKKEVPQVNTYTVKYTWEIVNTTPLMELPNNVKLPSTVTYAENDYVIVDTTYPANYVVSTDNGKWVFSGWDTTDFTITEDTEVHGTWTYVANELEEEPEIIPPEATEYTLTQKYFIESTNTEIAESWVMPIESGNPWEFIDAPETITFRDNTYELKEVTGDDKSGDSLEKDLCQTATIKGSPPSFSSWVVHWTHVFVECEKDIYSHIKDFLAE